MRLSPPAFGIRLSALACVCLLLLVVVGCDKSGVGKTVPVSGKVTVDGQPLESGSLSLKPDSAKGNTTKVEPAATISGGSYEVSAAGKKGAPPGWYKITVVSEDVPDSTNPTAVKSKVNAKYKAVETTTLSFEVKEGAPANAYDLALTK